MDEYRAKIEQIYKRTERLVSQHDKLKQELAQVQTENQQLKEQLKERDEKMGEIGHELSMVKVAKQLSAVPEEEKVELKKKINEFIREIDKCVALLND